MALLAAMPSQDVIDGLRGSVDFYRWCNLVIARSWPHYTPENMTARTKAQATAFAYLLSQTNSLPAHVVESWEWLASQSKLAWRDWMARAYLGGTFVAPGQPPL